MKATLTLRFQEEQFIKVHSIILNIYFGFLNLFIKEQKKSF